MFKDGDFVKLKCNPKRPFVVYKGEKENDPYISVKEFMIANDLDGPEVFPVDWMEAITKEQALEMVGKAVASKIANAKSRLKSAQTAYDNALRESIEQYEAISAARNA